MCVPQLRGTSFPDLRAQPNEDRLHVSTVTLPNHPTATAGNLYIVLDGHVGPQCVEYAIEHLPGIANKAIQSVSAEDWSAPQGSSGIVCKTLARVIQDFDDSLQDGVMGVLPPVDQLEKLSNEEIDELVKDEKVLETILRCHTGSTALIVLHVGRDIWTAGIGDCAAAVGTKTNGSWVTKMVSCPAHNIRMNPKEKEKVLREHPGEEEHVVAKDRILGIIAVSRGKSFEPKMSSDVATDTIRARRRGLQNASTVCPRLSGDTVSSPGQATQTRRIPKDGQYRQ